VEEQFYLIVPWVLKYTSRNMLFAFCVGIILCANARLCYLSVAVAAGYDPWYDPIVQFECFAAGILLSISLRGRLPRFAVWHRVILIAASWICWVAANYLQDHHFRSFEIAGSIQQMCHYGLVAIGCVMMLMAFLGVSPKLLPGFLIYLGRISFGLYVYHEFAIFIVSRLLFPYASKLANPVLLLRISIELGLTILMAALSYRYFETPFLKMKRRHAVIRSQPIGTESTSQNV
jgi:peptidoglycan/LPS O-acetylase OafA/YrhL